jgi:hypothetical protein
MLEVKVPEWTGAGHQLSISTEQLRRYLNNHLPMFYVLPVTRWNGSLNPATTDPLPAASWWRQRSENWFGGWTCVLSAADVRDRIPMDKANPVLYTVPGGGAGTGPLPKALESAFPWKWFWWEVRNCGPDGAVVWRITTDPGGRLVVTNLADQEQVTFLTDEEDEAGPGALRGPLPVQQGDNLVVVHIDEKQLRANSFFSLLWSILAPHASVKRSVRPRLKRSGATSGPRSSKRGIGS